MDGNPKETLGIPLIPHGYGEVFNGGVLGIQRSAN